MKKLKALYEKSKSIPVGQEADCPSCRKKFIKKTKAQAFCGSKTNTKCKDKYWNTVTPHKRNNTTRISPASAAWMTKQALFSPKRKRYTSEGYEIIDGVAYDEWGHPVYSVDPNDDTHPLEWDH